MARVEHPGKKSYFHLLSSRRKPTEYAIQSSRLDYYRGARFEVDAPLAHWFERHGAERDLGSCDWERFEDPNAFTYASYVSRRRDDEMFVGRLLEEDETSTLTSDELVEAWSRGVSPLRFFYHALQMCASYVAHIAPASKISIVAMFQAADELRRVQRVAYRLAQLERRTGIELANAGRETWLTDPAWQGMRALVEMLLVTYDFSEAVIALNAAVVPVCDRFFLQSFSRRLDAAKDVTTARLLDALHADTRWHQSFSEALFSLIKSSGTVPSARFEELAERWRPRVSEALAPLATNLLRASDGEVSTLFGSAIRNEEV